MGIIIVLSNRISVRIKQVNIFTDIIKVFVSNKHCVLSCFSHVQHFATLWTVARQVPLSMGFSRKEYWSGLPYPPPGVIPDPGIERASFTSPAGRQAGSLPLVPPRKTRNKHYIFAIIINNYRIEK